MKSLVAPFTAEAKLLADGDLLSITGISVKTRKHLTFTADISTIGNGKISIGHGYMISYASWVEITSSDVAAYSYYTYTDPKQRPLFERQAHGIDIKGHRLRTCRRLV